MWCLYYLQSHIFADFHCSSMFSPFQFPSPEKGDFDKNQNACFAMLNHNDLPTKSFNINVICRTIKYISTEEYIWKPRKAVFNF